MRMKCSKKLSSFILCIVLIVATALSTTGCNGSTGGQTSNVGKQETEVQTEAGTPADAQIQPQAGTPADEDVQAETNQKEAGEASDGNVLGEGSTKFTFTVVDKEGTETQFEIHTDQETVGGALLELSLIAGDESEYGLYVKTVNGITADYDKDGVYWAFYINGEYAQTGVDVTPVTEGDSYTFKVE